jgi:hypothetical protein
MMMYVFVLTDPRQKGQDWCPEQAPICTRTLIQHIDLNPEDGVSRYY